MDTDPIITELDAERENACKSTLKSGRKSSLELITRAEPRRRWSVEQKQAIAAESLTPGASPTEVARRHGISSGLLYTWRKALLAAQPAIARFARVDVAASVKPAGRGTNIPPLLAGPPVQPSNRIKIVLPNRTSLRVDAQLVAGFSWPSDLPETRCGAGFSATITGSGKIQFSGASEWLEAAMDKRFPRNWISHCLNNLSCRTFPLVAAARH